MGERWPRGRFAPVTAIAIAAGIAMFNLPGRGRSEMVLNWRDAEDRLPFSGGLSLAGAVASTGLDGWFGQQVTGLGVLPTVLLVAAVAAIVLFLTEITSNTATAATTPAGTAPSKRSWRRSPSRRNPLPLRPFQ